MPAREITSVEHKLETEHIGFSGTTILDKVLVHRNQLVKKAPMQKLQQGWGLESQSALVPSD